MRPPATSRSCAPLTGTPDWWSPVGPSPGYLFAVFQPDEPARPQTAPSESVRIARSEVSTSFTLAAVRALHVDTSDATA